MISKEAVRGKAEAQSALVAAAWGGLAESVADYHGAQALTADTRQASSNRDGLQPRIAAASRSAFQVHGSSRSSTSVS
jgi:hypothetical protein